MKDVKLCLGVTSRFGIGTKEQISLIVHRLNACSYNDFLPIELNTKSKPNRYETMCTAV